MGRVRRGQTRGGGPCGSYRYTMSPPVGAVRGAGPVRGARFRFFVLPDVVGGAYAIERGLLAGVGRRDDGWRFRGERVRSPVVARARPGARCPPGAGRPGARVSGSVARARSLLERARGLTETIGIGRSPRGPGRTRRHRTVRTAPCRRKSHPRAPTYDRAPRRTTRRPDVRPRRTRTHRTTSTRPPPPTHRRCPSRPHPRTRRTSIPDGAERSAGTGTVFSSSPRTHRRGSLRGRRGRGSSIVTSIFGRAVPPGPARARARGVLAVPAVPARRPVLVPRGAHEADHNE